MLSRQLNEDRPNELSDWLKSQSAPVVIMHHETPTAAHYIQRNLASSTVTPLTEFQISQYQVRNRRTCDIEEAELAFLMDSVFLST